MITVHKAASHPAKLSSSVVIMLLYRLWEKQKRPSSNRFITTVTEGKLAHKNTLKLVYPYGSWRRTGEWGVLTRKKVRKKSDQRYTLSVWEEGKGLVSDGSFDSIFFGYVDVVTTLFYLTPLDSSLLCVWIKKVELSCTLSFFYFSYFFKEFYFIAFH